MARTNACIWHVSERSFPRVNARRTCSSRGLTSMPVAPTCSAKSSRERASCSHRVVLRVFCGVGFGAKGAEGDPKPQMFSIGGSFGDVDHWVSSRDGAADFAQC